MSTGMVIVVAVILLAALLIGGVPVPFAFAGVTIVLVLILGEDPAFLVPASYNNLNTLVLLCIPLFMIAGAIIREGKIGDALIKDAFRQAAALGCDKMDIGIVEENQVLRKWYESSGFIHTGTRKIDFYDPEKSPGAVQIAPGFVISIFIFPGQGLLFCFPFHRRYRDLSRCVWR